MLLEDQHPDNKSIMVAVLGAPNVGKSSMINSFIGMDLSIVTQKPQTTRNKFHCVCTVDRTEIVFVDTPGLHKSSNEINKRYNQQALEGADGADVNLILIDLGQEIKGQFSEFRELFKKPIGPAWVIFTKSDLIPEWPTLPLEVAIEQAKEIIPSIEKHLVVSTKTEENMNELIGAICDSAEAGPHFYEGGEISNKNQRFFATEFIREQAFNLLNDELPYEVAVLIEEYKDGRKGDPVIAYISASIIVNRPSQRGIVVGSKGSMIKEIGSRARMKIEAMIGGQIHLNLHVKVMPKWFKNNFVLEEIGLPRANTSARVWKKK
ncbi:MAG: GTPase Era [Bacteriovoracaceae bacterium]|nr:GTPase Era [Bacteriovoracaceae bacterium]